MSVSIDQSHPALLEMLAAIRRRARMLSVLFGVGVMLAAAVGALLLVVGLDYLLNLPAGPRAAFIVLAVGGLGYLKWKYIVRPLFSRLTLSDVAGRLESAFPQFDDRLRSTIDFVRADMSGSPAMRQRTVSDAEHMAAAVNLNGALAARPVLWSMAAGAAAVLLAVALAVSQKDLARIALSRLLLAGGMSWPKSVQIDVLKGLPAKVPAGQRVDLRMRLAKGDRADRKAIVYYKYDNGRAQEQIMSRGEDGTYSVAIDARGSSMTVWMKAGDDQTAPQLVDVVQGLAIRNVNLKITPPPYAKLVSFTVNLSETPATMTVGSNVELQVNFNKPLAADKPVMLEPVKAQVKLPQVAWAMAGAATAVATWTAGDSLRFRVHAIDQDYFKNPGLEEYELIVRPDQLPSVIIEEPSRNEDRTPQAVVRMQALAEDDFDITSLALVVDRKADGKHWEIPLSGWFKVDGGGERRRFRAKYDWELSRLPGANLKPGDALEYYLRVTDNYNLNGAVHPPVPSGKLRLNIISQETLSNQVTEAIRAIGEKVRLAQNSQTRNKQETQSLRQDTANKPRLDQADRTALARLIDQQSTLASQTRQLAGQMAAVEARLEDNRSNNNDLKGIAKEVRSTLNDTAERPMSEASKKLSEAAQPPDPKAEAKKQADDRGKAMEEAEARQQQASENLARVMAKMGNLGTFEALLQKVRDALSEQQGLSRQLNELGRQTFGKRPEELTGEQKKKLDELADQQRQAGEKTDKLTKELNKSSEQTQKSDPAASKAMQEAARQAQQQQVAPNQQQAAQNAQQNQQAQAQAKQKQAELGLQIMLDTMREAQRRKLEQLSKELAKLQELIANLVRRQAGHNIDNLRVQDVPEATKLVTDELVKTAERLKDKMPPKPEPPQLANSQILTERNTRDVSRTAEDMQKGGAEIAAVLTKAAGFMERAIVSLREPNLKEAYDPSQVRALASLEEAARKVDEAAADAQKEQEEADKDAIRQVYEKIKAEQEKLNAETTRIDSSPRLPDGTLRREDAVKLGRLPGEQGGLADKTQAVEEDLVRLGGIVYVWANKDIVNTMNGVKSDLGKPETGKPTQAEQTRIVEQLDSMIRNLAVKPLQKEFNQQPGGGQGGGGSPKPKMPSEAELRLLKDFQVALNKSTRTIDAQPKKDKEKLVGLGTRQGELRNLLDQLVQKASNGEVKLDPEPDPKDRLPEEAGAKDIENQEMDEWLRGARSGDDQLAGDMKMVGQRMARSRQRLALDHDPGKVTQLIQERILKNLDNLIEMSRQQMAQAKPGKGKGQQAQRLQQPNAQPNQGVSQLNPSKNPAGAEKLSPGDENKADPSKDIRSDASEWGRLTPRERQAIIEGVGDSIISKYKKITDDYYEMMGKKGSEQR